MLTIITRKKMTKNEDDSKESDDVIIYAVSSSEDESDKLYIDEDTNVFETVSSSKKLKKDVEVKVNKIPISKRFKIKKGKPITDLKSLIYAFTHPSANSTQKDLVNNLKELDSLIGMEKLKEQIINQILFFVQDMHDKQTFLHTVITGPPGTGKTRAINILAKIYCNIGILESNKVVTADRSKLVGKWCGHTATQTKEVLKSAKGGVLILDEVYSLGNKEGGDSFSKECIDTINQYLSEHVDDFICVIAGYKDLVYECFFNINPGLERRFPWRFTVDNYTPEELMEILKVQLVECGWKLCDDITDEYITKSISKHIKLFKGNGGDTKNLIDKCKVINARRVFTELVVKNKRKVVNNKVITKTDFDGGLKSFVESSGISIPELPDSIKMLYL